MNRPRCPPPTDEQLRSITAFIRSGGFPLVAAEAAGVSRERFEQWLQLGSITKGKTTPYRTFTLAVRQAVAEARLKAEIEVFTSDPVCWLRNGPKDAPGNPGWSALAVPVKAEEKPAGKDAP